MSRVRLDRPRRILRAFATSSDGMRVTAELIEDLGEEKSQRTLAWYGGILRRHEQAGFIERVAWVALGWGKGRTCLWQITDMGRQEVRRWDHEDARRAEAALLERVAAEAATKRATAVAGARESYGRSTPRDQRRHVALELRSLGSTCQEIAEIFGVSRQAISQDLLLTDAWTPGRPGPKPREKLRDPVWIRRGIRPRWARSLEEGMLAGLTNVTLTEW